MWYGHRDLEQRDMGSSWTDGPQDDGRTPAQRAEIRAQVAAFEPWRAEVIAIFTFLEDWARCDGYTPHTVLPYGAEICTLQGADAARTAVLDRLERNAPYRLQGEKLEAARLEVRERLEKEARDAELNRRWREEWEREERERRAALDAPRAPSSSRVPSTPTAVFTSAQDRPLLRVTPDDATAAPAEAAPALREEAPRRPWHEERAEQLAQAASLGHLLEINDMGCGFRGKMHTLECEGKDEIFRGVSRASDFEDILRGAIRILEAPPAAPAEAAPATPAPAAPASMSDLMGRFGKKR